MINSLYLLAAAVLVFVFGYRFFAKFLNVWVFRLDTNYSTPARQAPGSETGRTADNGDFSPVNRHLVFAHHAASLTIGLAILGAGAALHWGWIPAFLWIVVGSVVMAGTFGVGSLWLATRRNARSFAEQGAALHAPLRWVIHGFVGLVLLVINTFLMLLIARLLTDYAGMAWIYIAHIVLAWVLGRRLAHGKLTQTLLLAASGVILLFVALWWSTTTPLGVRGALSLDIGEHALFTIDAVVVWIVLLAVLGFYVLRRPLGELARPQALFSAAAFALVFVGFLVALVWQAPNLVAPAFHHQDDPMGVFPWLFLVVTSGAMGAWQAVVAHSTTVRQLERDTDTIYIGYGGALLEGTIALSALIVGATAAASPDEWIATHTQFRFIAEPLSYLTAYIDGVAALIAALGLDLSWTRNVVAFSIAALSTAALATGLRAQKYLVSEFAAARQIPALQDERRAVQLSVAVPVLIAVSDGVGRGALSVWPLWGSANLLLGVLVLTLIALALQARRQPLAMVLAPFGFLATMALWGLGAQGFALWRGGHWGLLGLGLILAVLAIWATARVWRILAKYLGHTPPA